VTVGHPSSHPIQPILSIHPILIAPTGQVALKFHYSRRTRRRHYLSKERVCVYFGSRSVCCLFLVCCAVAGSIAVAVVVYWSQAKAGLQNKAVRCVGFRSTRVVVGRTPQYINPVHLDRRAREDDVRCWRRRGSIRKKDGCEIRRCKKKSPQATRWIKVEKPEKRSRTV